MPEHSTLTGSNLHEPKGAATAAAGKVIITDGAGSTSWKYAYSMGWEDQHHAGGSQSLTAGSFIDLNNDGLGANTNETYVLPGTTSVWDPSNNEFDWSAAGLSVGDTVDIRFDFSVTTSGANHVVVVGMDLAHGAPEEYKLSFDRQAYKSAGTYQLIVPASLYIGNTATLENPAKVIMFADSAGDSVLVNGWFVRVIPRKPVFE